MAIKTWWKTPCLFDKSDILILIFVIFVFGMFAGNFWRYFQIEPILNKEISLLYRENKLVVMENENLKARLAAYQIGLKKK